MADRLMAGSAVFVASTLVLTILYRTSLQWLTDGDSVVPFVLALYVPLAGAVAGRARNGEVTGFLLLGVAGIALLGLIGRSAPPWEDQRGLVDVGLAFFFFLLSHVVCGPKGRA